MFQAIRTHSSRPETTWRSFIFVRFDKVLSTQHFGIIKQSSAIKSQRLFFIFLAWSNDVSDWMDLSKKNCDFMRLPPEKEISPHLLYDIWNFVLFHSQAEKNRGSFKIIQDNRLVAVKRGQVWRQLKRGGMHFTGSTVHFMSPRPCWQLTCDLTACGSRSSWGWRRTPRGRGTPGACRPAARPPAPSRCYSQGSASWKQTSNLLIQQKF